MITNLCVVVESAALQAPSPVYLYYANNCHLSGIDFASSFINLSPAPLQNLLDSSSVAATSAILRRLSISVLYVQLSSSSNNSTGAETARSAVHTATAKTADIRPHRARAWESLIARSVVWAGLRLEFNTVLCHVVKIYGINKFCQWYVTHHWWAID